MAVKSPVVFFIFNRPEITRITFRAIRESEPSRLWVVADGSRDDHPEDLSNCELARTVTEEVDWPCEVTRLYSDHNLGLKHRISGALNTVFEQEERAIILEDDCLAHPHFFHFCDDLLERFESNSEIVTIGGTNFLNGEVPLNSSYYFSRYNHCWGWATWRRAWQAYDGELSFWPHWRQSSDWKCFISDKIERMYWERIFDKVHRDELNSWAYPWTASVWYEGGLTATPAVNLVQNIGFGESATNTSNRKRSVGSVPLVQGEWKLDHPESVARMKAADRYVFDHFFGGRNLRFPRNLLFHPWALFNRLFRS